MISHKAFPRITSVTQNDIKKLENPVKELSGTRNSIVFIYPCIVADSLGGSEEEFLLRRYFAGSLLKEIDILNLLDQIEHLLSVAELNQRNYPRSHSDIATINVPISKSMSAYYIHQIVSKENEKLSKKSLNIYKQFKHIITNDPYYQKYQAMIIYKTVNDVKVPMVIGTKNFQASDIAIAIIILISILYDLPLDSLANIRRIERLLKSRTITEILNVANRSGSQEEFTEKISNLFRRVGHKLNSTTLRISYSISRALGDFIFNLKNTRRYKDLYIKLTSSDIDQALTIFKLCTNIHYYSRQLNDRFTEFVIRLYERTARNQFLHDFNEFLINIANNIPDDFRANYQNIIEEAIDRITGTKDLYSTRSDEEIIRYITKNIDEIIDIRDKLNEQNIEDINLELIYHTLQQTISDYIRNIFNVYATHISDDLIDDTAVLSLKQFLRFIGTKRTNRQLENVFENLPNFLNEKHFKKGSFILNEDGFKRILAEYDILEIQKNKFIYRMMFNGVTKILNYLSPLFGLLYTDVVVNLGESYIDLQLNLAKKEYFSDQMKYVKKATSIIRENVRKVVNRVFYSIIGLITIKLILLYMKSFFNFLNVDKYVIDEKKLGFNFPNYYLIVPEELIDYLANMALTMREDILTRLDFDELEPKKIIAPISTNTKYNVEYILNKTRIPSIAVLTKNKSSVIYRFPYMKKVEKTSIEKIQNFMKVFDFNL